MKSKQELQIVLQKYGLQIDPLAVRMLSDDQVFRVWNSAGDLLYYNQAMLKITSYTPLDLCYHDLKTLWSFEDDGYDKFKNMVTQTLMGKELVKERVYRVKECFSKELRAENAVKMAVPLLHGDLISGVLISGNVQLLK